MDMKVGYILCQETPKPTGVDRFIKGCIDELKYSKQLELIILGQLYN